MTKSPRTPPPPLLLSVILLTITPQSPASGFAIIEQGVTGLGNAYAGVAAIAEDSTTVYFNPAGMTYLTSPQALGAVHVIKTSAVFRDGGSTGSVIPIGTNLGGDAGDTAFVPNIYYVGNYRDLKIGLGINAPFGLKTEYDKNWIGRYASIKSELETVNINPSIAFKTSPALSIGLGFNLQYIDAELTNAVNVGLGEGFNKLAGDDWSAGFNLGAIYQLTPATRLGVAYRSEIDHQLEGKSSITNTVALDGVSNITTDINLPSTTSISISHDYSDKLTVMADITHTKWSNFEELRIINSAGATIKLVNENWSDSFRYSLGLRYQPDNTWTFRTGVALDETPIKDNFRTARIPGDERIWVTLGTRYQLNNNTAIDIGYAHLWINDASINEEWRNGSNTGTLLGSYEADANILNTQISWDFD